MLIYLHSFAFVWSKMCTFQMSFLLYKSHLALLRQLHLIHYWELSNEALYQGTSELLEVKFKWKRSILLSKFGKPKVWLLVLLRPLEAKLNTVSYDKNVVQHISKRFRELFSFYSGIKRLFLDTCLKETFIFSSQHSQGCPRSH